MCHPSEYVDPPPRLGAVRHEVEVELASRGVMPARLSVPAGNILGAVVVVTDIFGANAFYRTIIDRLAAEGIRFEYAYVQNPVCNPSRASFMSGLRPSSTNIYGNATYWRNRFGDDLRLLPEHWDPKRYWGSCCLKRIQVPKVKRWPQYLLRNLV